MTDSEAVDTVIRRTGNPRYRYLCDPAQNRHRAPNSAADYLRLVRRMAAEPEGAVPAPAPMPTVNYTPITGRPCGGCGH